MSTGNSPLLFCDTSRPKVHVIRFVQPDMRMQLDADPIDATHLFVAMKEASLDGLPEGHTVILNLGLIDLFPTAFYRLLLRTNEVVKARGGTMLMCCLPPLAKEAFTLMGGAHTFAGQVWDSEARALYAATHPPA